MRGIFSDFPSSSLELSLLRVQNSKNASKRKLLPWYVREALLIAVIAHRGALVEWAPRATGVFAHGAPRKWAAGSRHPICGKLSRGRCWVYGINLFRALFSIRYKAPHNYLKRSIPVNYDHSVQILSYIGNQFMQQSMTQM